jgi:hypothetical protein
LATAPFKLRSAAQRTQRPWHYRTSSTISARVERMYIAFVAFALGAAGTAIGFAVGVVPYFKATFDLTQYDWFFLSSISVCAVLGFIVGIANGARWYRATEASPLIQRRMLAYMHRHATDERGTTAVRTLNAISLRSLLGTNRQSRA